MDRKYYLAVDIGASSGRHILGWLEDGILKTEEVYRFPNGMEERDGTLVWDAEKLFGEILEGIRRCGELGKIPESMGIDTWGVDYALLDGDGNPAGPVYGYRDARTSGMDRIVERKISAQALYARTGIQKQPFNTIYQLTATKEKEPEILEKARALLLLPDYFHYRLTGRKCTEYTNATTTQLVSPLTKDWDCELIDLLGLPRGIFGSISMPGTEVGRFTDEIRAKAGFDCRVVLPATHDTGSAVAAVPAVGDDVLYISSGTWSLMGTELKTANCSEESRTYNLTNEGGVDFRFRYLKNIMGLWMIQSVRRETAEDCSYAEMCSRASEQTITSIVDCNDARFMTPVSMTEEIRLACRESGQQEPENLWETAAVIYNSLGKCYADTADQLEAGTGRQYSEIHVIGGGSNADYLNQVTADMSGRTVFAGPSEATAVGNLIVQMRADGLFADLKSARECVGKSFEIRRFDPAAK